MAASVTLGLTPGVKLIGVSSDSGRDVFVWKDKKVTDEPVRNDKGMKVYRHKILLHLSPESDVVEATAMLESPEPLGVMNPISLEQGAKITISQGKDFDLRISVSGALAKRSAS